LLFKEKCGVEQFEMTMLMVGYSDLSTGELDCARKTTMVNIGLANARADYRADRECDRV
jgi:hypothetical protein